MDYSLAAILEKYGYFISDVSFLVEESDLHFVLSQSWVDI